MAAGSGLIISCFFFLLKKLNFVLFCLRLKCWGEKDKKIGLYEVGLISCLIGWAFIALEIGNKMAVCGLRNRFRQPVNTVARARVTCYVSG